MLAGLQVHHPAPEAGLLEQQPVALQHVGGLAFGHVEALQDVVAVVRQLGHLASEVLQLIEPYSIGTFVLL